MFEAEQMMSEYGQLHPSTIFSACLESLSLEPGRSKAIRTLMYRGVLATVRIMGPWWFSRSKYILVLHLFISYACFDTMNQAWSSETLKCLQDPS